MREVDSGRVERSYRGYFWADVYNWDEPPYQPGYYDIGVSEGLTLSPSGDNVAVGQRLDSSVTLRNFGDYPAAFKNLFIWVRGPNGENLDQLLGGAEQNLEVLQPGEERLINRSASAFGNAEGSYVVGVSYLSKKDYWLNISAGPPGTTGQQKVVLRNRSSVAADQWFDVRESDSRVDTGIDLRPGDEFALTGSGSIWAGVWATGENGPEGWADRTENNPRFPLHSSPEAHPFSLVAAFDGEPYFLVGPGTGRRDYPLAQPRRLILRTNDDVPGNGSGAFRCRVQVWR